MASPHINWPSCPPPYLSLQQLCIAPDDVVEWGAHITMAPCNHGPIWLYVAPYDYIWPHITMAPYDYGPLHRTARIGAAISPTGVPI